MFQRLVHQNKRHSLRLAPWTEYVGRLVDVEISDKICLFFKIEFEVLIEVPANDQASFELEKAKTMIGELVAVMKTDSGQILIRRVGKE